MVVVIEVDQLAELQMAGQGCRLRGDAFHQIAVADDRVCEMVDDLDSGTIVTGSQMRLGQRQTHAVAKSLTERPRCRLDAWRDATLGVARRHAPPFAKPLDLLERNIIAGEVQQTIE